MLKHLLSTRTFIAAVIFFVFTVGGSLYYYPHEVRLANQQLAETKAFLQRLNERDYAHTTRATEAQTRPEPPASIEGTALPHDAIEEPFEVTDTLLAEDEAEGSEEIPLSDETLEEEQVSREDSLSSFDFVPETEYELRKRVEEKLLEQGIPVRSSFMENGLVYPKLGENE